MICPSCNKFLLTLNFDLCDICHYARERREERLAERETTLGFAAIAGWALSGVAPHRLKKAWGTW